MIRGVIFDLDGTLIDSAPDIAAAVNTYLGSIGQDPLPTERIAGYIGNGPRRIIEDVLADTRLPTDDASVEVALSAYMSNYLAAPAAHTRFFESVEDDLYRLHSSGLQLGICTNKPHALTGRILKILGIDHLFASVLGCDAVAASKPDPGHLLDVADAMGLGREDVVYVGDSKVDQRTALLAGIDFFVVPWGTGPDVSVDEDRRLTRIRDVADRVGSP